MSLTQEYVLSIFSHLTAGNASEFFAQVADDVDWVVTGDSHPLGGRWNSKDAYLRDAWSRIGSLLTKPMKLNVEGVVVEPSGPGMAGKAVVELRGVGGVLKNGKV
jgi:ketosteroid isomerase-like protein